MYLLPIVLLFGWTACLDGPSTQDPANPEEARRREAIERHRARQEAACERVSAPITECAIASARAEMPPEKFAELDVEKLRPRHQAKFIDECISSDMSPRQVKVFEDCMADTTCEVFLTCLDQAKPKR